MEQLNRIAQNPLVMGGKACIRAMRVTVGMIVGQIDAGQSVDNLLADYPIWSAKTFCRLFVTQHGWQKSPRSCWRRHESASRDEHFTALTSFLAGAGIESEHWSTVGIVTASDFEIIAYAKANGYVVLRHDLDFSAILGATHIDKPSVVQIRADDVSLEAIGNQIVSALLQMASELEEGAASRRSLRG